MLKKVYTQSTSPSLIAKEQHIHVLHAMKNPANVNAKISTWRHTIFKPWFSDSKDQITLAAQLSKTVAFQTYLYNGSTSDEIIVQYAKPTPSLYQVGFQIIVTLLFYQVLTKE